MLDPARGHARWRADRRIAHRLHLRSGDPMAAAPGLLIEAALFGDEVSIPVRRIVTFLASSSDACRGRTRAKREPPGTMVFADVAGFTRFSERLVRAGKEGPSTLWMRSTSASRLCWLTRTRAVVRC